jgi:DNA polymerase III epsilon subunit-like protein
MPKENKLYCSLDIETSGFDPLKNEVLEIGFVFFELPPTPSLEKRGSTAPGFKITDEYTRVFKPNGKVEANILGLTGISQDELDSAEAFSEHKSDLQKKLKDAVIVGHNIAFDIKFLESTGLKFSGEVIDTLDLVQWILPTHHSYNLENLMHTFGISHKEAHRALADSKATLKLLEKLLQVYSGFPEDLKNQIRKLIKPNQFPWEEFLRINLQPLVFSEMAKKSSAKKLPEESALPKIKPNTYYNFSLGNDYQAALAGSEGREKLLLVVPKAQTALKLYKQRLVGLSVFLPEWQFDEKKFLKLLAKKNTTPEELKFILKILVWQKTNWQTETFLDLNLSFFGGQFKGLINGGKIKDKPAAKTIACDLQTFFYLSENNLLGGRQAVICGLNELEAAVTANIGTKTSWGYINYLLKSFYNPELGSGDDKLKDAVAQGLLAGDLFFGLTNALLQTDPPGFVYFKISQQTEYDEKYQKIKAAAESYTEKLLGLNKFLSSGEIEKFAQSLENFFKPQENRVKWIELSENRCSFLSMPLDITSLVQNVFKNFSGISLADALGPEILPKFFLKRLGTDGFKTEQAAAKPEKKSKQGDLFSRLKSLGGKTEKITYHCLPQIAESAEIINAVKNNSSFPAAVLFGSSLQVRQFYDQNYQELKQRASVLAQNNSGGSNKIFRNFAINPKSVMLVTDKFILKHLTGQSAVEPVNHLKVKTLVICRLPFEQFTHPYQEAVSAALPNAFEDYALPRALYNFHSLIKFFYSPELKDIYVIDAKLAKSYAKVFKDYYKFIPAAELKA